MDFELFYGRGGTLTMCQRGGGGERGAVPFACIGPNTVPICFRPDTKIALGPK